MRRVSIVALLVAVPIVLFLGWTIATDVDRGSEQKPLEAASSPAAAVSAQAADLERVDASRAPDRSSASEAATAATIGRIAAGVVVDENGAFVKAADVEVWAAGTKQPERGAAQHAAISNENGRFVIDGTTDVARVAIQARHPRFLASDVREVARGTETVRLVLRSGGSLPAAMLLPGRRNFGDLALRFADEGTGEIVHTFTWADGAGARASLGKGHVTAREVSADDQSQTELRLECRLPAATYAISVALRESDESLALVPHVVVTDATENRDPRVDPIDLRAQLTPICLRIVDDKGVPVGAGWYQVLDQGAGLPAKRSGFRNGDACFYSRAPRVDVLVGADGFQTEKLGAVSAAREVVLRRAFTYELTVTGVKLPEPPAKLRAVLVIPSTFVHDESNVWRLDLEGLDAALIAKLADDAPFLRAVDVAPDGKVTLAAPERGKLELRFFVFVPESESTLSVVEVELPAPSLVEIDREVTLGSYRLDPGRVDEALARARPHPR